MGALKSDRCSKGHAMSGENLYQRKDGQRECRQCSRDRAAAKQRNRKSGMLSRKPGEPRYDYDPEIA